jgi:pimeloyl-ACP methyl ester carboxylesterase
MFSLLAQLSRQPEAPLRLWLRTTSHKLRPPRPRVHAAGVRHRQEAVLAAGLAGPHQCASVLTEPGSGPQPTIVLGGFVPDATEAVYLLRGNLLRQGSLYYFNYPRRGFSTAVILAQLGDLIEEVTAHHRRPPVVLAISFGAGVILEWLRQSQATGALAGLILVSPVTTLTDLLDPAAKKATTLLGRVVQPYLRADADLDGSIVEKSRTVFLKMFESGAQNQAALRFLLTRAETHRLRDAVLAAILAIEPRAARERVQAMHAFAPLSSGAPLLTAPTLVLFAEKEGAVLRDDAPGRLALESRLAAWFPRGRCLTVCNQSGHPVQHASLIFHAWDFLPAITTFYRTLRTPQRHAA